MGLFGQDSEEDLSFFSHIYSSGEQAGVKFSHSLLRVLGNILQVFNRL